MNTLKKIAGYAVGVAVPVGVATAAGGAGAGLLTLAFVAWIYLG